ncbi:MAG: YbaN family protein [Acidimicrobiia bacterium]
MTADVLASRALRGLYMLLGGVCLVLGIIGLVAPVMPGTVFILLAAFFFARSSKRVYGVIIDHPRLGPLVEDYQAGLGIPMKAKVTAVFALALSFSFSMTFFIKGLAGRVAMVAIGAAIIWYIVSRPTKKPAS